MTFLEPNEQGSEQSSNQPVENHKSPRVLHWLLTLLVFSMAIFIVGKNTSDFHASVIPTKQAAPFDGTVMPILTVPKWTSLGTELYKASYDNIPSSKMIPIPEYDPAVLKTSTDGLGWKLEKDLAIRNAKITYSVVYMGNYKLDGVEYAGSHLAVDIKIPDNTPVYAIANGVVDKVSVQSTGFGNHIVIKHENVPSLESAGAKTTLYSTYNHLTTVLIAQGDVVTKGQLIGKSGHTGTATTPHLHFQIDNDQAPWHPYWPFTYLESDAAGVSFFDAVNIGLGADKGKQATINPMLYVQKYLNASTTVAATSTVEKPVTTTTTTSTQNTQQASTTTTNTDTSTITDTTNSNTVTSQNTATTTNDTSDDSHEDTSENTVEDVPAASFEIEADGSFAKNSAEVITIKAVDSSGNIVKSYSPKDAVYLKVLLGKADIPFSVSSGDFANGVASVTLTPTSDKGLQIKATDGTISGESDVLSSSIFSDVSEDSDHYKAISFLKKYGIVEGYPDGSFKPQNVVSRVEALKFILKGANAAMISDVKLPFKDAKENEWYFEFVATGYNKNIIKGYPDKTFKPGNTVTRVEFLKMMAIAMELDVDTNVTSDPYDDVSKSSWYAPYAAFAKAKNLIDVTDGNLKPDEGMTREEVAETLYRMIMIKLSAADSYNTGMTVSSSKIQAYFG